MRSRHFPFVILPVLITFLMLAQKPAGDYKSQYAYAEKLYNDSIPTDQKDSLAFSTYLTVIQSLKDTHRNDSVLMDAYFKAAIYQQTFGHFDKAIPLLRNCLDLYSSTKGIPRQAGFLPNLYLGNSYYSFNRYDSARYFYKQAEQIAAQFPAIPGLQRLYNAFGVMNFETGNYRQSRNNFEKAISLYESNPGSPVGFLIYYKGNLASSLRKLYEFDAAMAIYRDLLKYQQNTDEINQNIASIYLQIGASPQAIKYLHSIKRTSVGKFNDLGQAHFNQHQYDSAHWYFQKAIELNHQQNGDRKNIFAALTFRYRGDLLAAEKKYDAALKDYQSAITQMIFPFNDTGVFQNPASYSGVFAVTELYETLLGKAVAFRELFNTGNDLRNLEAALHTFRSLYQLTDYVEKTYESDEARIFLNQKKYSSHHIPIDICLQLYKLTGKDDYLQEAFYFDEKNKASVLYAGLLEKEIKKAANIPESLLAEESNCKENINRLSLKAASSSDSSLLQNVQIQLREQELKLETISKKIAEYPAYEKLKFVDNSTSFEELQKEVIPEDAAILSYHIGDSSLLCWVITQQKKEMRELPKSDSLLTLVKDLNAALQQQSGKDNQEIRKKSRQLYQLLFQPLQTNLKGYQELMIIPDDELSYLPFEMLLDEDDHYLVEKYAITYNYACSLLRKHANENTVRDNSILAMAPYTGTRTIGALPPLPASSTEISQLGGTPIEGAAATRELFLKKASGYGILHLATHAQANDKEPYQSYIAFYPQHPDSPSLDHVYIPDIYSLQLNKTYLTILSACETGNGQLVKGEGIISLSRAFSYAGCPNMITSQWKADDAATSYITQRLHAYIRRGNTIAAALQKAKLDYLHDAGIEGRNKTAAFWATLRFTGQFENSHSLSIWWWLLAIPLLVLILLGIKKIRLPLRSRSRGVSQV